METATVERTLYCDEIPNVTINATNGAIVKVVFNIVTQHEKDSQSNLAQWLKYSAQEKVELPDGGKAGDNLSDISHASAQTTTGNRSPAQQHVGMGTIHMGKTGIAQTANDNASQQSHSGAGNVVMFDRDSIACSGYDESNPPAGVDADDFADLLFWIKRHPAMTLGILEKVRQIGARMDEAVLEMNQG